MTVQEVIDYLLTVEDKSIPVCAWVAEWDNSISINRIEFDINNREIVIF